MLAEAVLLVPAQEGQAREGHLAGTYAREATLTLGTLARELRVLASAPERWWGLVRFDPDRSVRIMVEDHPGYQAWLAVLPPGHPGQDCDCEAATLIAGEVTEGAPGSAPLRPGPVRVHGQPHRLRGCGTGYSISMHARTTSGST